MNARALKLEMKQTRFVNLASDPETPAKSDALGSTTARDVAKVARALKPRGALVLQEYLDWGAMKLVPRSELFDRVVAACLESWKAAGATMDIGDHVPTLAERCGLSIELFRPEPRLGGVGSLEWRWLSDFFRSYLPKVAERGLLAPSDLAAHFREWDARERAGTSWCYPPTVAAVILRKP